MGNIMSSSFAPECTEAKTKYDNCFNGWYTEKFLKGKSMQNECEDLWHEYKECIDLHLMKRGIKPMLDEAEKDAPFANGGKPNDNGDS